MKSEESIGLDRFLSLYPRMRVQPSCSNLICMEGQFEIRASFKNCPNIEDSYRLSIRLPQVFPRELPQFFELGGRIPRDADHHVFPEDGSLCLGSPLRLYFIAKSAKDFTDFVQQTLVPYLYAISHCEKTGKSFLFGELKHGKVGLFEDYVELLQLRSPQQVDYTLSLLAMKKRLANKKPCPCGCGSRLGVCSYNKIVRQLREHHGRAAFERALSHLRTLRD